VLCSYNPKMKESLSYPLFTYLPVMNTEFGSHAIGLRQWGLIVSTSLVVYIVIEFEKWIRRRTSV